LRWEIAPSGKEGEFDMKRIHGAMAAMALLFGPAGYAEAAVLYTAPAEALTEPDSSTTHRLCCDIVNTSRDTRGVSIHIRARTAAVVMSFPNLTLDSQEGTSRCVTATNASYCQFDVEGSKRFYRALAIYDAQGAYRISLPAR
jgi:hypothetical protein